MNRQQANAEIAKRLWPSAEVELLPLSQWVNVLIYDPVPASCFVWLFDVFADEAAARELVQWFADQPLAQWFIKHLREILFEDAGLQHTDHHEFLYLHLLATPKQKALAACKVWGIELEEEGK